MPYPVKSICRGVRFHPVKAALAAAMLAGLAACGSSGSSTLASPAPSTRVRVNLGDGPADEVAGFSMTIDSLSLRDSMGGSVTILRGPTTLEMTHLMGAMQPLGVNAVPQGTYTGATLVIGSAVVSYMDPATHALIQKTLPGPMSASIPFNGPMTVSASPMALNMDMDLAASVSIDAAGNVAMTPAFHTSLGGMGSGNPMDPENGGIQHLAGAVTSASSSGFTLATMMGSQSMSFQTNGATSFQGGLTGTGMMTNGMLVWVDAELQSDGSMLATAVQQMGVSGGSMGEGLVNTLTGNPPTALTLVMQNGMGEGMMASDLANTVTLDLTANPAYTLDSGFTDLTGLPFTPAFDGTHIFVGQRVSAVSASGLAPGNGMMGSGGMMAGTLTAAEVELEPQGLSGTVSGYTPSGSTATFVLTLPADSAFTSLTGAASVLVFQQGGTELVGMAGVADGDSLHVRGLLFYDGGQWKLVASRMMAP